MNVSGHYIDFQTSIADNTSTAPESRPVFHPNILLVHWELQVRSQNWTAASNTALAIMAAMPAEPIGWIYRSFALQQLGRVREAWENLIVATRRFPNDWRIPYNLASYTGKLGDRAGAWNWLDRAMELGDPDTIKALAIDDPLFQSFWQDLGKQD